MQTLESIEIREIPKPRRSSKYDMAIIQASQMEPGHALWLLILPKIRPLYNRIFRFGRMRFRFRTINRTIPNHVSFIIPISNTRLKNLKLAVSRRIRTLGYQDKVKPIIRSRKLILVRV